MVPGGGSGHSSRVRPSGSGTLGTVGVTVPEMSSDGGEDLVGGDHCPECFSTAHQWTAATGDTLGKMLQFVGQRVGVGNIGFADRDELAEDTLLEVIDVGPRLCGQFKR